MQSNLCICVFLVSSHNLDGFQDKKMHPSLKRCFIRGCFIFEYDALLAPSREDLQNALDAVGMKISLLLLKLPSQKPQVSPG